MTRRNHLTNLGGSARQSASTFCSELLVERRIERARQAGKQKRVAVRWRVHDRLGAAIAACTCPVLDDECLPKPLRQRLTNEARDAVGCLASRKGNDDPHWPRRIGLRHCEARQRLRPRARKQLICLKNLVAARRHISPNRGSPARSARLRAWAHTWMQWRITWPRRCRTASVTISRRRATCR